MNFAIFKINKVGKSFPKLPSNRPLSKISWSQGKELKKYARLSKRFRMWKK
jgi:hypothetical protein